MPDIKSSHQELNKLFTEITADYLEICSAVGAISNSDYESHLETEHPGMKMILESNLMQVCASMNDLAIHLQALKYSIQSIPRPTNHKPIDTNTNTNTTNPFDIINKIINPDTVSDLEIPPDSNKLINKAIKDIMPMLMMHLMKIDKDSILNKPIPSPNISYNNNYNNDPDDVD